MDMIDEAAESNDAVRTCDVAELASKLHQEMQERAIRLLLERQCSVLAASIRPYPDNPSSQWVRDFCRRHKLVINEVRTIDGVRSLACETTRVMNYFQSNGILFNRNPLLIFNMDETECLPGNRFKVVVPAGRVAWTKKEETEGSSHMTAVCCFSAGGTTVPSMFILKGIKRLPEYIRSRIDLMNVNTAWYAASESGWMTEHLFYAIIHRLIPF